MRYQRLGGSVQVRFESGETVMDGLVEVCRREGIAYGVASGLGAISWVRLGFYNAAKRGYDEHEVTQALEVVSLIGNVALRDEAPFFHLHISLGRSDLSLFGGHFLDARAEPNLEVVIQPEAGSVVRLPDEASGLALMDLPEQDGPG